MRSLVIALTVVSAMALASCGEDDCRSENHCIRVDGTPTCEDGYAWQNPDDDGNLTCVVAETVVTLTAPAELVGSWQTLATTVTRLICKPTLTATSSGPAAVTWVSGTSHLEDPAEPSVEDSNFSTADVADMWGSPTLGAGQVITITNLQHYGWGVWTIRYTMSYQEQGKAAQIAVGPVTTCAAP